MKSAKNTLEAAGLKPTYPRLKVLEYLQKHEDHPAVEMIYEDLVAEIPTISKTTIYNTLNAFLEKGIIHGITITGTETRYDVKESPHHHLLCKSCGRIFDVEVHCPYEGQIEVDGHRIDEKLGYFKGVCRECLEKEE
ncbi:MAG: Fur family transcriptional regulator [Candidatus Zixiibacteriota bacterium]